MQLKVAQLEMEIARMQRRFLIISVCNKEQIVRSKHDRGMERISWRAIVTAS